MLGTIPYKPIKHVRFQPWVGCSYGSRSPRLLVVGMSHYGWEGDEKTPVHLVTNAVIGYWCMSTRTSRFFSNIAATCIGHLPNQEERIDFWNSIAFYNYIQEFVGKAARQAHPYELWERSESGFGEVLLRLKPRLILVIGLLNWGNIGNFGGWEGPMLRGAPESRYAHTWRYPVGDGETALAFHVKHVSAGYNFRKFAPLFREAEQIAKVGCVKQ